MHDRSLSISIRRLAGAVALVGAACAGSLGCAKEAELKSPDEEVKQATPAAAALPQPSPTVANAEVHAETVAAENVYDDSDWDVPASDLSLAPAITSEQGDRVAQRLAFEGDLNKRLSAIDARLGKLSSGATEEMKTARSALERERNDLALCSEERWPETKARIEGELASLEAQLAKLEVP
jgi:hypothetical protein